MSEEHAGITVVNFSHPISAEQQSEIAAIVGQPVDRVIDVPSQLDLGADLGTQVSAIVESCGLTSDQWETLPILVNLPALSASAGVVLSEISGRCGHLPSIIIVRRADGFTPKYEVAGIVNLQQVRDGSRRNRATVQPSTTVPGELIREVEHEYGD